MKSIYAEKVELLSNGQLAVTPSLPDALYEVIYRAAKGVEWEPAAGRFLSPSNSTLRTVGQLSTAQWFALLSEALSSELGLRLITSATTTWVSVPASSRAAIEAEHAAQR
jgi:hypothetical protein